jgi:DNA-binding response OmpR family regulator
MPRILIIEDDPFLGRAYTNVLNKEGFEVDIATDGQLGLDKATASEPDLIILDMLMPNMTGIEFLEKYDIKGSHPNVKVIVFSNMTIQEQVNRAIELGAANYKTKAFFSPKEMVALIRETLQAPTQASEPAPAEDTTSEQ